jgi:hypothetical protein
MSQALSFPSLGTAFFLAAIESFIIGKVEFMVQGLALGPMHVSQKQYDAVEIT